MSRVVLFLALWAVASVVSAKSAKDQWLLIAGDADYVSISKLDSSIEISDEYFDVKFCQNDDMAVCIRSRVFELAIPKHFSSEWHYGQRTYCAIRRFSIDKGDDPHGDYFQIMSFVGEKRSKGQIFDEVFIFSKTSGLRAAFISKSDFKLNMVSIDTVGFGAGEGFVSDAIHSIKGGGGN